MRKSVLVIALVCGVSAAFAQLSTRENDGTVQKIGARPKAGDMAFVFGTTIGGDSAASLFSGNSLKSGSLLTYKYYKSDDFVIRAGIRFKNANSTLKGTGADSSALYDPHSIGGSFGNLSEVKIKKVSRMYEIVPGVEKHFLESNIFDAYVAGDLYLGFGSEKSIRNFSYRNGDIDNTTIKTPTTKVGAGLVTGFNVFIAHLPISLGLEYGWSAKWTFGGLDKVTRDQTVGNTSNSESYKVDNSSTSESGAHFSKLKKREFNADTNQDVRLVLHIYFTRK